MATPSLLLYGVCVFAVLCGAATAFGAGNAVKRLAGLVIAHLAAGLLLIVLGSEALALALLASLGVEIALGAAVCARIAEQYGTVESEALAQGDFADEERG